MNENKYIISNVSKFIASLKSVGFIVKESGIDPNLKNIYVDNAPREFFGKLEHETEKNYDVLTVYGNQNPNSTQIIKKYAVPITTKL